MNVKKYVYLAVALLLIGSFVLTTSAFAQGQKEGGSGKGNAINKILPKVVFGTVSSISGNTLTISLKQTPNTTTAAKVFTVDATNAKITKSGSTITVSGITIGDTVIVQGTMTGTNIVAVMIRDGINQGLMDTNRMNPAVVGKVSAINGNILSVVSQKKNEQTATSSITFIVDATNAKILRGETVIKLSDIAIGDNIVVQGTVTGTNVLATIVRDGKVGNGKNDQGDNNQAMLQIQGNGQPIVAGKVSIISGSTITIANSSNITYTIDATNAKVVQGKNTIALSNIKIGDQVIVQGTVNGTSVIASTIIDQTKPASSSDQPGAKKGMLNSVKNFFSRLFGF